MKLAIAADHAGYPLKEEVRGYLERLGHDVIDLGAFNTEPSDYADFAEAVGRALQLGRAERGILICGSGVGVCVAANKMPGFLADDARTHHQDIHVVVLDALMSRVVIVAHAGADAGHFVGGNANADAAAADEDAAFGASQLESAADSLGEISIVGGLGVERAKIDDVVTEPLQIATDFLLEGITCVICSDGELHSYFSASAGSDFRARSTSALARATTLSTPKPRFLRTMAPGAEAPKRSRPMTSPWRPTCFHQPSVAPASMASLGR